MQKFAAVSAPQAGRSLGLLSWALFSLTTLGLGGCDVLSPPEKRACSKLTSLCGLDAEAGAKCSQQLGEMSANLGKERMDKLAACVSSSQSCPEAGGCMAGVGISAATDSANKFLKGVGKALGR